MKDFLKYYFRTNIPGWGVNYIWTLGSIIFAAMFLYSGYIKQDIVFNILSAVPILVLTYNIVSEWNIFKKKGIDTHLLAYLFYGSCLIIVLSVVGILLL
jgi:hypothetical protein